MITLNELFEVTPNISELRVIARDKDLRFVHEWIFGEYVQVSARMEYDEKDGELTINKTKINYHGDPVRGGSETGWGVKENLIPKELREAPIIQLSMYSLPQFKGTSARVEVEHDNNEDD